MSDKVVLNEELLDDVQGGMMKWSGGSMTMTYTHRDGSVTKYPVTNGDIIAAYRRSNALHSEYINQEEYILEILQQEGIVGQEIK
jgi:hypothetical protein